MIYRISPILASAVLLAVPQPSAAAPTAAATFEQTATLQLAEGAADLDDVVACFRSQARMPSFGHIATYPAADEAVYRLRFDGLMFESIRFVRTASGGTRAEIRLANSLSRAERAHFATGRGASLERCLQQLPMVAEGAAARVEAGL